jgi:uncharacterized protein YbjT (DUF2867 family)
MHKALSALWLHKKLAAQGVSVRALTSKAERAGLVEGTIRRVHANWKSGEGVSEVLTGVDRALIFAPPGHVPQNEILSPLIQAAARNSLERVTLLTALGANAVDIAPLRIAEFELERSAKKAKMGQTRETGRTTRTFFPSNGFPMYSKPTSSAETSASSTRP